MHTELERNRILKIGGSEKCDVVLRGYKNIKDHHATILESKGNLIIKNHGTDSIMKVNDDEKDEHVLKYEDVIALGSAKLYFRSR